MAQMAQSPELAGTMEIFDAIANVTVAVTGPVRKGTSHHAVNWGLAQRSTTKPVKAFFAVGPIEQSMFLTDEHYNDRQAFCAIWPTSITQRCRTPSMLVPGSSSWTT